MAEAAACCVAACGRPTAATLESRNFCRQHFIAGCYARLNEANAQLIQRPLDDTEAEQLRRLLQDCVEQVTVMAHSTAALDNLERAQLLDIALWATEITRRVRRSPRIELSVAIRVEGHGPTGEWIEETCTRMVSRHGAALPCQSLAHVGDEVQVTRLDNKATARAKIVWRHAEEGARPEIGIEFLDSTTFWD